MRRPLLKALGIILFGTIVLPGCFYAGPGWWDPDHDEGRHRHGEWRERRGALTPQRDNRAGHHEDARRGDKVDTVG